MLSGGDIGQGFGAGAEIGMGIGKIRRLADQAHSERRHAPALADTNVEKRGFQARVRPDEQDRIRLLNTRKWWD